MALTYSLNGTESSKLSLQIALVSLVAKSCDDEGLESIAPNVLVLVWLVYMVLSVHHPHPRLSRGIWTRGRPTLQRAFCQQLLAMCLLLRLHAIAPLEPTLGRHVSVFLLIGI
jgi:hypothetical protein